MDPVITAFLATGVIIFIGYFGDLLFRKYRIPDILILILVGALIGPVFHLLSVGEISGAISSIFVALALVMILFDGGLNLNFKKVIKESPKAATLAVLGATLSIIFVSIFARYIIHLDWIYAILLGSIVAGSSSSIIIPLVSRLRLPQRIRTLLSLESAFTDVFVVILGISVLQLIVTSNYNAIYIGAKQITAAFSVGAMFGILFGLLWIRVMKQIEKSKYAEIMTLGFLLLIYALTEFLGGSGAMFALFFGLVLGNGFNIGKMFEMKSAVSVNTVMRKFHAEIAFFIRTFFFVYMGMILVFNSFEPVIYAFGVSAILLFARWIVVKLISIKDNVMKVHSKVINGMLARGLSAAVVSQMVLSSGIQGAELFPQVTIYTILITVSISAIASFFD